MNGTKKGAIRRKIFFQEGKRHTHYYERFDGTKWVKLEVKPKSKTRK